MQLGKRSELAVVLGDTFYRHSTDDLMVCNDDPRSMQIAVAMKLAVRLSSAAR